MDVAEWQKRMTDAFPPADGALPDPLDAIIKMERDFEGHIEGRYVGHAVAGHCFFLFYEETIQAAIGNLSSQSCTVAYLQSFVEHATSYRSFRATDILSRRGYPLDGYALLRDLKDRAIAAGAVMNELTTLPVVTGWDGVMDGSGKSLSDDDFKQIVKNRKKEERRVSEIMLGKKSGLDPNHLRHLERWEGLFHEEVHGSHLSMTELGGWIRGQEPFVLGPQFNERSLAMYINRFAEIAWLHLRTFPFLQTSPRQFGDEWCDKWVLMDESLRAMVQSLSDIKKAIADAIMALADAKFVSTPDTCYIPPNESAYSLGQS